MKLLSLFLILFTSAAQAATDPSATILSEYNRLRKFVASARPEYDVADYFNAKSYGDHELFWRLDTDGNEVIRIFREKSTATGQPFDVTFYRSRVIAPGRVVIRRFVGPANTGWRNDTVDLETGEYLGSQGASDPALDSRDRAILKKWKITLIQD